MLSFRDPSYMRAIAQAALAKVTSSSEAVKRLCGTSRLQATQKESTWTAAQWSSVLVKPSNQPRTEDPSVVPSVLVQFGGVLRGDASSKVKRKELEKYIGMLVVMLMTHFFMMMFLGGKIIVYN